LALKVKLCEQHFVVLCDAIKSVMAMDVDFEGWVPWENEQLISSSQSEQLFRFLSYKD